MNLSGPKSAVRGKRIAAIALAVAVALGIATAVAVPLERAAVSASSNTAAATKPHPLAMGSYPTKKYTSAGSTLPSSLVAALKRDVHLTPAQYLANSAAAIQGVKVVAALKAHGVHVLGSSMSGTRLTVNVSSSADAAVVSAAGAKAIIGAPKSTDYSKLVFKAVSSTYGGEAYFYQDADQVATDSDEGFRCSIGFNGYAVSDGSPEFATAGHCATAMDGDAYPISLNKPTHAGGSGGVSSIPLGAMVTGEGEFGDQMDYGIVSENPSSYSPQPSLYTWGKAASSPTATAPLAITGETFGITGATLCKSGSTSGWTCGAIKAIDQQNTEVVDDNNVVHDVNAIIATTCLLPGDSGGGAVIGSAAAGIDSASDNITGSCTSPKAPGGAAAISIFFPMMSAAGQDSVQGQQGSHWQLAVSVPAPAVTSLTSGSTVTTAQNLSGSLATSPAGTTVSLYLDGSTTAASTVTPTSGKWSFPLSALSTGTHQYSLVAKSGWSSSVRATGSFTLVTPVPADLSGGVGDFNGDGHADVIARDSAGNLWFYPGNGVSSFGTRVELGTAATWKSMTAIAPVGDFNGDGHPDLVARDSSGTLWLYPGNGSNGFGARVQLATGWQVMATIQGVGDFNGDGHPDILARNSNGVVFLYPGDGHGNLGSPVQITNRWQTMTSIVGVGDFNKDGKADLLVRDSTGTLWLYPGTGTGTLGPRIELGAGWSSYSIVSAGDFNHNGTEDVLARDSTGTLWMYPGTGTGTFGTRVKFGAGWTTYSLVGDGVTLAVVRPPVPASISGGVGDFNGDGNVDYIALDTTGSLWLYPGNGKSGFGARILLATGWQGMTAIVPVGDLDGNGHPDLVARDSAGTLWLYPGNGAGGLDARVQLATGWGQMTMIQGVADLTGDGHPDIVARDNKGVLWLYPGTGSTTLGARQQLATGWGADTAIVGVGDFDGDGFSDLMVRNSAGVLMMYPGNGDGTLGAPVTASSGWSSYTIISVGDFNHDGAVDLVARDSTGALWLYPGNGMGKFGTRVKMGSGWSPYTIAGSGSAVRQIIPANVSGGAGDFTGDGDPDMVARDSSGTLWLYPGNGKSGFGTRIQLATGWQSKTAIIAVGDLDGDGHPDVVAREADGTLSLYSGSGSGELAAAKTIGSATVWGQMTMIQGVADLSGDGHVDLLARNASGTYLYPVTGAGVLGSPVTLPSLATATAIVGVGDFNGDGTADLLVRTSAGVLTFYPGTGTGALGAAVSIGSGWSAYTIVGAGDFNNNGTEDVLARDSAGALWLYPGTGAGKLGTRVAMGSGWSTYTFAGSGAGVPIVPAGP